MSPSKRHLLGAGARGVYTWDLCTFCGLGEAFHDASSECQVFSRQGSPLSDGYETPALVSHARQVKPRRRGSYQYLKVGGASSAGPRRQDTPQCAEMEGTSNGREQISSGENVGETSDAEAPTSDHCKFGGTRDTGATSQHLLVGIGQVSVFSTAQPERQERAAPETRERRQEREERERRGRRERSEAPETRERGQEKEERERRGTRESSEGPETRPVREKRDRRDEQQSVALNTRETQAEKEREATQKWREELKRLSPETRTTPESVEREVSEELQTSQEWPEEREGTEELLTTQMLEEREGDEELLATQQWEETVESEELHLAQEREDQEVPVERQVEGPRRQAFEGDDDGECVRDICGKCLEREKLELCLLCVERRRDAVLFPCGHRVCCLICADKLEPPDCPVCRVEFELAHPIFDA